MLNRARRITAQAVKKKQNSQSHRFLLKTAKYMIIAGARPNEIASTRESSSDPNREPVPVARATRPSSASAIPPATTEKAARLKSPRDAETIAYMPQSKLKRVKPFGRRT